MLRQVLSFVVVISSIQYYVLSVNVPEYCVALHRCPELLSTFQKEERLISLKDFLSEHTCSGSIFPPPKVHCDQPQAEKQIASFQDLALEPVHISISPVDEDLWSVCDCGYSPKYKSVKSTNNTAEEGMFPWMVQIYYTEYECVNSCDNIVEAGNVTLCGGSIITKRHILTSAHCVMAKSRLGMELKVILLGAVKREKKVYDIKVSMVYSHPNYSTKFSTNDIAILYLEEEVKISDNVRPVCLHSGPIYHNTRLVSAGWGLTKHGNYSEDLLYIDDQVVWNREVCNVSYNMGLTKDMFCSKGLSGSSVCEGDSGGPLVGITDPHPSCSKKGSTIAAASVWTALGVTSFGSTVCDSQRPVVFAHVAQFLPWIKDTVERARLSPIKTRELFSKIKSK